MTTALRPATEPEAEAVLRIMRAAFEEYRGVLSPPSGVLGESAADVLNAMRAGGAFLAFDATLAVGASSPCHPEERSDEGSRRCAGARRSLGRDSSPCGSA